jgi:Holliday junction resolvase
MTNAASYKEDGTRVTPLKESASRKGDLAEFYAVTWLWDHGYEVFLNAGCTGPIDMIAYKDGEITLVDVKSLNSKVTRTDEQKKLGVVLLRFDPKTRKLSWVDHRE